LDDCGKHTTLEKNLIELSGYWLEGVFMVSSVLDTGKGV
jgi:hypothetical protein